MACFSQNLSRKVKKRNAPFVTTLLSLIIADCRFFGVPVRWSMLTNKKWVSCLQRSFESNPNTHLPFIFLWRAIWEWLWHNAFNSPSSCVFNSCCEFIKGFVGVYDVRHVFVYLRLVIRSLPGYPGNKPFVAVCDPPSKFETCFDNRPGRPENASEPCGLLMQERRNACMAMLFMALFCSFPQTIAR